MLKNFAKFFATKHGPSIFRKMVAVDFLEGPAGLHRRTTHDLVTDDDDDDALTGHQSPVTTDTSYQPWSSNLFSFF
jgi:hypothetical protein